MTCGTITSYTKGKCRCPACASAWRDYQRTYMRERYHGRLRLVPIGEAGKHVRALIAAGMKQSVICASSGVDRMVVRRILCGTRQRIRRQTAEALLGVTFDAVADGATNFAAPATALMVEMRRAGVTNVEIEERLRISVPERIANQQHVRPKTWAKLTLFYRHLARQGRVPADLLEQVGA